MSSLKNKWYSYFWLGHSHYLAALIFLGLLTSSVLGYLTPLFINDLYKLYGGEEFRHALTMLGVLFVGEYLNRSIYQAVIYAYVTKLLSDVRNKTYANWIHCFESIEKDKKHEERYPLGEVISRMINDAEAVQEMVGNGGFTIFLDFLYIIFSLISFIQLNTQSGVFLIALEVLICWALIAVSKKMGVVFMEVRKATGIMTRVLSNITTGFREIFYTPHFNYAQKKSEKSFNDFLEKQLKANIYDATYYSFAESLFPWLLAFLIFIFPYSHITEMAVIAAVIDLIQRSINPIKDTASKITTIQRAKTGIERIQEFNFDLASQPTSRTGNETEIEFKSLNVNIDKFCYNEASHFSLENIHFAGEKGQTIGIVGLSGSGKSTLLKILATEILCPEADISIEANPYPIRLNINDAESLNTFKRQISLVSQDSHIFSHNLKFNLGMGKEKEFSTFFAMALKEIPYLQKWNVNAETMINPKTLSLGQKQLLSALRALYLKKPVVLFDEIASGLDSDLEAALSRMVELLSRQSLTIIVAHRLETIMNAQQILLMHQGKLVDKGTHFSLETHSALYQDFISQLKRAPDKENDSQVQFLQ